MNDRDFDVALHIVFDSIEAHDAYQDAPSHHQFINENKPNWKVVRVFDADVESRRTRLGFATAGHSAIWPWGRI